MKPEARKSLFCRTMSKSEAGSARIYLRIPMLLGRRSLGWDPPLHPTDPDCASSFKVTVFRGYPGGSSWHSLHLCLGSDSHNEAHHGTTRLLPRVTTPYMREAVL